MYASERSQEVTNRGPQPFYRVGVHFSYPISIIVPGPLLPSVMHSAMRTYPRQHLIQRGARLHGTVVSVPLVGVQMCLFVHETKHVSQAASSLDVPCHSQPHLPTLPADTPEDRGAVGIPIAMPPPLVGSPTRRVSPVGVQFSLFPPRSETSRLFQFVHRVIECWVAILRRWFATPSLSDGRCSWPDPTLWQGWHWAHLSAHPSTAALPAQGSVGFSQT